MRFSRLNEKSVWIVFLNEIVSGCSDHIAPREVTINIKEVCFQGRKAEYNICKITKIHFAGAKQLSSHPEWYR